MGGAFAQHATVAEYTSYPFTRSAAKQINNLLLKLVAKNVAKNKSRRESFFQLSFQGFQKEFYKSQKILWVNLFHFRCLRVPVQIKLGTPMEPDLAGTPSCDPCDSTKIKDHIKTYLGNVQIWKDENKRDPTIAATASLFYIFTCIINILIQCLACRMILSSLQR